MYKKILHATDLEVDHFNSCQQAHDIAKKFNASLYLIHVISIPTSMYIAQTLGFAELSVPLKSNAKLVLDELGETFDIPKDHIFVEEGNVTYEIFKKIDELACDLLIIGSHNQSKLPPFLGSNAFSMMQSQTCDILMLQKTN